MPTSIISVGRTRAGEAALAEDRQRTAVQHPNSMVLASMERDDDPVITFTVTISGRSAWTMAESVTLRG
jgi:hypothetical protein